jgi:hypothetical protein
VVSFSAPADKLANAGLTPGVFFGCRESNELIHFTWTAPAD